LSAVKQDVPVLIGEGAKSIINATNFLFPNMTPSLNSSIEMKNQKIIQLGPFKITPYLVDHSAYDSYAVLIESEGKRLFYSGDIRGHGRKERLFKKLISHPPNNINGMLMEGTTLDREDNNFKYPTERGLEDRYIELFEMNTGIKLVWTAGQNIDRLVTLYKSCRKTKRIFIVDMYTASILRAIGNPKLPQPGWNFFKVYLPWNQKKIIKDRKLFDFAKLFSSCRVYPEELERLTQKSVMLFRPSMVKDLENAHCLKDASLIYSLWSGYLKDKKLEWFHDWLEKNSIALKYCHTSGHAPVSDLQKLAKAVNPDKLIPIHSFKPELYKKYFDNVTLHNDRTWWEL